jgi:hypothetical protein
MFVSGRALSHLCRVLCTYLHIRDTITGELLRGYWHHGKPTAPFQALETGTGYAFHAVRVAFAHNRPEVSLHSIRTGRSIIHVYSHTAITVTQEPLSHDTL